MTFAKLGAKTNVMDVKQIRPYNTASLLRFKRGHPDLPLLEKNINFLYINVCVYTRNACPASKALF